MEKPIPKLICAALGLVVAAWTLKAQTADGPSFPTGEATEFARVTHDESGAPEALQLAIARYATTGSQPPFTVDLIGAVHVGDKGYYAELNQRFRDYDAVLFELIAPPGSRERIAEGERKGFVSGAQLTMTRALGLSFQLDEIDYTQANLVHADLSPAELKADMEARGESLYVYFWRMFYASVQQASEDPLGVQAWRSIGAALDADIDNPLKIAFAYEMTNVRGLGGALEGADGSALIAARNQRALEVLKERVASGERRLGIFYGVAHMPDFERRLRDDFELEFTGARWVTAWRLNESPSADSGKATP